jgi:hypothetical protein
MRIDLSSAPHCGRLQSLSVMVAAFSPDAMAGRRDFRFQLQPVRMVPNFRGHQAKWA